MKPGRSIAGGESIKVPRRDGYVTSVLTNPAYASGNVRSRALRILFGEVPIIWTGARIARVPSETIGGRFYVVNLLRGTCACPAWRKTKRACKHIVAACIEWSQTTRSASPAVRTRRHKNPPYYDCLRRVRKQCLNELFRCAGVWANHV